MPKVEEVLTEAMEDGAEQYIQILQEELPDAISGAADNASATSPNVHESNLMAGRWFHQGHVSIIVELNPDDIQRDSFNGDMVQNIISLFDTGYSLSSYRDLPYGYWHGKRTVALRERYGEGFMARVNSRALSEIEGLREAQQL